MRLGLPLFLCVSLFEVACASHRVIRDREYESSVNAYRAGDTDTALRKFPHGEKGGMITSLEQGWLSLWGEHWDPEPLQKQAHSFDSRKYISLSREAGYFLFQEAEEGYIPAEHEVVLLHLVSATEYLQLGKQEDALVELRQAGYVLDHFWDDSALRLWLGSLWAAAGQWNEAQVDFRRANQLSPNRELAKLAEGPPVPTLALHFYGVAPVMVWNEGSYTPAFKREPSEPDDLPMRASTLPWFERHSERNTELRDVLVKSNFMAQYLGGKALTGTERGMNKAATWSIKGLAIAVGVAVTAAVLYVLAESHANVGGEGLGYLLAGGLGASAAIWKASDQLDDSLERSLRAEDHEKQEDLKIYRVARFLPGWVAVSFDDGGVAIARKVALPKHGVSSVVMVNHF